MRIALFSDIHGNLTALRAVLAALNGHRPLQMIVAAGDHVLAGPRPAETWDALQAAGCTGILGNQDVRLWNSEIEHTVPDDSPWKPLLAVTIPWTVTALGVARLVAIRTLPRTLRLIPAPDADLLVVHANIHGLTGWALKADTTDEDLAQLYGGANACVVCCGHYHAACVREWGGMTLVNVAASRCQPTVNHLPDIRSSIGMAHGVSRSTVLRTTRKLKWRHWRPPRSRKVRRAGRHRRRSDTIRDPHERRVFAEGGETGTAFLCTETRIA